MKNISVKMKMLLMSLVTLLGLLVLGGVAIIQLRNLEGQISTMMEESIRSDYDDNIKKQVDNAISLLDTVYAKSEAGECTLEEAEKEGADLLRELRYGESGYFWADTYDGDNVVLFRKRDRGNQPYGDTGCAGLSDGKRDHPCRQRSRWWFYRLCVPERGRDRGFAKTFLQQSI